MCPRKTFNVASLNWFILISLPFSPPSLILICAHLFTPPIRRNPPLKQGRVRRFGQREGVRSSYLPQEWSLRLVRCIFERFIDWHRRDHWPALAFSTVGLRSFRIVDKLFILMKRLFFVPTLFPHMKLITAFLARKIIAHTSKWTIGGIQKCLHLVSLVSATTMRDREIIRRYRLELLRYISCFSLAVLTNPSPRRRNKHKLNPSIEIGHTATYIQ